MAVMTDPEAEVLAEFRQHMIGQRSGDASVIDVRHEWWVNEDAKDFLLAELVLADPPPGVEFWPHRDVHELQRRGEVELRRLRVPPPYFVGFKYAPKPGELAEDDEPRAGR